jgi:starch-binding outer membrane protein, SusD/RagB family
MKKIEIIFFVLIVLVFQSCNDFLNIRPENETVLDEYWQSESQATAVLASCYRSMTLDDNINRMIIWGEARSENVNPGASTEYNIAQILGNSITPTNSYANWGSIYTTINYCNTFLHYAPGVVNRDQNFSPAKLHALEAEAKAIRALCYFYLVRTFKNVPLVTQPSISDDQDYFVGQAPERQVLDTIISDLVYAQQYAKTDYTRALYNKGRITKNAVNSILADVYLWDQQYQKCAETCDQVLSDTTLILVDAEKLISNVFYTGNSTESIFELQFDINVQNSNAVNSLYGLGSTISNQGQLSFAAGFLARNKGFSPFNYLGAIIESTEDIREYTSYGTALIGEGTIIYKYAASNVIVNTSTSTPTVYAISRSSSDPVNWIVYRLSDVILMKAEALVQLNRNNSDLVDALKLVNRTYLRSNITADSLQINSFPNQTSMEKLVLRERQREFLFEGKRWFDLVRLARRNNNTAELVNYVSPKLAASALSKNKLSVMDALYMPVLKSQIDINSKLTQNPFYADEASLSN